MDTSGSSSATSSPSSTFTESPMETVGVPGETSLFSSSAINDVESTSEARPSSPSTTTSNLSSSTSSLSTNPLALSFSSANTTPIALSDSSSGLLSSRTDETLAISDADNSNPTPSSSLVGNGTVSESTQSSSSSSNYPFEPALREQQLLRKSFKAQRANGHTPNGNNSSSSSANNGPISGNGLCTKCPGKRRHTRTCPFRKREEEEEILFTSQQIINKLDVAALKRYKRHYRLKTRSNSTKAELMVAVKQHYDTMQLNEVETIELFLSKARN
eukprot:TRINITY_DN2127_c0_g1_i1.p1 TRINITY_DN2127_c0_g1~~TRINITY_DN2127_c0_g1_i1.p1  ORF type:complete len:273 (-),score=75.69 TRINITY_DN2127_c0_g1_i1:103-921(-)